MKTIDSFTAHILDLDKEIHGMKEEMNVFPSELNAFEAKQKEIKRINMISEILAPLKKNIHREMLNNRITTQTS